MPRISTRFDFRLAGQRLVQSQTIADLEEEWAAIQQRFQNHWERKGRCILFLIHDDYSGISDDDVTTVLTKIAALEKRTPIDFILHTHGGYADSTYQIAAAIVSRPRTAAFVPLFAKSGGTLVALATQKIFMGKGAVLSPVDLQIWPYGSARELVQLARKMGDDAPPDIALAAKEAEKRLQDETTKIDALINWRHKGFFGWRGNSLATALTSGEVSHSESIGYKKARKLHISACLDVPKSVFGLITLRLEQLRRLRELEGQINLIERPAK